jgi:hypothetical protein
MSGDRSAALRDGAVADIVVFGPEIFAVFGLPREIR